MPFKLLPSYLYRRLVVGQYADYFSAQRYSSYTAIDQLHLFSLLAIMAMVIPYQGCDIKRNYHAAAEPRNTQACLRTLGIIM